MVDYTPEELEYLASLPDEEADEIVRLDHLFSHVGVYTHPPKFLIDGFLPLGYCVILAGDPKAGKTALASAIGSRPGGMGSCLHRSFPEYFQKVV